MKSANVHSHKAAAKKTHVSEKKSISPEMRKKMIAEAAYYIAERRSFQGGNPLQDWLQAEQEFENSIKS